MTSMSLPKPKTDKSERPAGPNHGPSAAATAAAAQPKRVDAVEPKRTEKSKALEAALGEIEKSYGKGAIMRLGDSSASREINGISTGSIGLDVALGGKGLPKGRVVEIYGPESSGKTTLTLHVIANAQKAGGIAAFVDAEHALDPAYARKLGVKLDDLLVSQPDTGEQALEIVEALVRSNAVDVVVIDSVAALVPRAEIAGEMGDSFVGLHARLMSQALRKLTGAIAQSECLVIFINQIREKIGVMFGSPETTTGGRALKFYASVRLDIRKIGPPFRKVEFDMLFGRGISREGELLELGVNAGVLLKSGTWLSFKHPTQGELRLGQGMEKARAFLVDNPDLAAEIEKEMRSKLSPAALSSSDDSERPAAPLAPAPGSQTRL
jgi:recombination protein RecA